MAGRSPRAPAAPRKNRRLGNQGELHFCSARDPLATDKMAAAPPEVTHGRGVACGLIGALSIAGSEGAGGVTSILREDILEEGTLSLADARVFRRHLKCWQGVFFFFFFFFSLPFSHGP